MIIEKYDHMSAEEELLFNLKEECFRVKKAMNSIINDVKMGDLDDLNYINFSLSFVEDIISKSIPNLISDYKERVAEEAGENDHD